MKVLIVTASLNERSGWGRYSRAIIDQLIHKGVDISVCSENKPSVAYPIHRISPLSLRHFFKNLMIVRRATKDADIVHALDGWPYGVYAWAAVLGTRKRFFMNGVATYSVAPLYRPMQRAFLMRAYARARTVFCVSEYTADQIAKSGVQPEKLQVVLQGATPLPIISKEESGAYAAQYGIIQQHPIVLTVGEIKDRKGQFDTLRAVELLKRDHPNILYVTVGSTASGYAKRMKEYCRTRGLERNLLVVTNADDRSLSFFYDRCDVFALNSTNDTVHHHFEGFGLVIVEAYQFAKPAVGSRDCGIEDAIQDGKTGLLANQNDSNDIAAKIAMILKDHKRFSENAGAAYYHFDWSKTVEKYIQGYMGS